MKHDRKISILGKTLKAYRKREGLTAPELSLILDMTRERILQIENGQAFGIWRKTMLKIIKTLNLTDPERITLTKILDFTDVADGLSREMHLKIATQTPPQTAVMLGKIQAIVRKDTAPKKRTKKQKKV